MCFDSFLSNSLPLPLMKPSSSSSSLAFFESQSSGGCILGVLRSILCSRSLPSDTCSCSAAKGDKMMKDENNQAVPGLVARLMGLDTIPERKINRSRSLNSSDDQHIKLHLHRRSKSSREIPTYIELYDDDFIVLKFNNRKMSPRANHKREKTAALPETHEEEQKQHGRLLPPNAQVANQQQPAKIESCNQRESNSRIDKHIRIVQKKTQSTRSDTEESSPVSIFDFQEPTSDDDSWTRSSSSSSRVSSPEQDNAKISTMLGTDGAVEGRHTAALLNNTVVHVYGQKEKSEMRGRVCDITCAEIKGAADTETDWCVTQDLVAEYEVHIMDHLLNDLLLLLHSI